MPAKSRRLAAHKGWFRMVGTLVGAVAAVVLTACFPQNRAGFLVGLAVWGRRLRFCRDYLAQFRVLRGSAGGLHYGNHCE
ncbi:MAG: FUSC family protein [Stellaceae bacterium]